jgi:glycosyltransferase involved in cell wall biosynthesis
MPVISVVVPIYNVEAYLPSCIDSVLSQSFSDFECVLVDDGSPDNCPALCDGYAAKDGRVTVVHQENSGVTIARKKGVEKSKGEYICFVDGDDTLPVDALLLLLDKARLYDLDILVTAKYIIQNNTAFLGENAVTGLVSLELYIEASLLGKCAIGPHGSLIKKKLFGPDIFAIDRNITDN